MKKILFLSIPFIYGFLIYIILPNNNFFSNSKVSENETTIFEKIIEKNNNDPLTRSFENLLSRLPFMENNYPDILVYYHDLWLKNNCVPKCSDEKIKEKIKFYDKQPIQHSLFQSIIFEKDIIIPYTNFNLKKCLEFHCREVVGTHKVTFELTSSEKHPKLSEKINDIVLKNRSVFFSKYIDNLLYSNVDSIESQEIKVFFDKIVTIKKEMGTYTHGTLHWYGNSETKHYNVKKNRLLKFNDVFKKNSIKKLSKFVFNRIQEGYTKPPNLLNPIEKTVSRIDLWNFTNEGIYLFLPPYEEGGYMSTHRDFSYEEMKQFLTPFGKSLR